MKQKLTPGMTAPNFTFDTPAEKSLDFSKTAGGKTSVIFFLRYMGCPLCQLKISEIIRDHDVFKSAGCGVFIILQSGPDAVKEAMAGKELPFTIICDPAEKIYNLYGVVPGNIFRYLAPSVIMKAMKASRSGFKHGKKEGKELQLPAVFIVNKEGKISYAHYGKNIGDVPDNGVILEMAQGR